jgi:tetratricopeptide (TPR) repeat protein
MASATNDLAFEEKDATIKDNLIKQAYTYLDKALELAPKHHEIYVQQIKVAITAKDYQAAERYAKNCIALNPNLSECHFYLGLVNIYTNNKDEAQNNLQIAAKGYSIYSKESLEQLSNAYGFVKDYQNLVVIYESLVGQFPQIAQYHSSFAFFYKEVGRYKEARGEALKVLELSPESKKNVEDFLKTLPQ